MSTSLRLLDVVVLTADLPEHRLARGQVGTVVEALGGDVFEVEFTGRHGWAYALAPVPADRLLVLHQEPVPLP